MLVSMQGKANKAKEKNEERKRGLGRAGEKIWSRWESLEVSRLQLHEQHVPEWAHATKGGVVNALRRRSGPGAPW